MIGISKEKLANINPWVFETQQDLLNFILDSCKELDLWLPIEDAPKDIPLLVYYPTMPKGLRFRALSKLANFDTSIHKPTHYKELDDEPNPDSIRR